VKNTVKTAFALALLALSAVSFSDAASINSSVTTATLDNGLKVIVQEDHSVDLVAVDVWVRAGSRYETAETNGVSHFIEHLLFKATDKRSHGQVDMEIESLGASLEARTSRDWAHFYTVVAQRYLEQSLDVLADVVANPKFHPADIEHERNVILDEIARQDSNPMLTLRDQVFKSAFTTHPYGLPVQGTRDSVKKITREMIVSQYNRLYVPENITVILVGDISPVTGVTAVKKAFGAMEKKSFQPVEMPKEPEKKEQTRKVVKANTKLSYLAVAFPAPSIKEQPDVFAMDILTSYLGTGYQSWMAVELRDKQRLAVEVSSEFITHRDPSVTILVVAAEPGKIDKAEEAIFTKIEELRTKPISEGEMLRARRSLEGGYAFDVETFSGRAATLGFYEAADSFEFARSYIQNLRKVTTQDIQSAAQKYLDPDKAVVVLLGQ